MPTASVPKVLCATALAIMAGAVVFSRLADDGSMLSAIRRVEQLRIDESQRSEIERARDAAIRRVPDRDAYFATRDLLNLLSDAASGTLDWQTGVQKAEEDVAKDADNLVARLAYAVLLDMYKVEWTSGSVTPQQRAQGIRQVADTTPPAAASTFHHVGLLQAWNGVLGDFYERPDVAASSGSRLWNHETLLLVCGHVLELRSLLSERGATKDAGACRRWLVECLGGLMLSETDAETRLLCADLIARTAGAESNVGRDMLAMRRAYREAALSAPIDLCDQAFTPSRSVAPVEYRRAMWLLAACLCAAAVAVGGMVCLLAVGIAAPTVVRFARRRRLPLPVARPWWARLTLAIAPAGLGVAAVAVQVDRHGLFAANWGVLLGVVMVSLGILTTILLASFCTSPPPTHKKDGASDRVESSRRLGPLVPYIVMAMFVAIPLLPPTFLTRVYRNLDLTVGGLWVVMPIAAVLILVAKRWAPARLGTLAATAALVSCLYACLAVGLCLWHSAADEDYQQAAVRGHADEVAARLGADWQSKYLAELVRVYDVPGEGRADSRR